MLDFDASLSPLVSDSTYHQAIEKVLQGRDTLLSRQGEGKEYTDWLDVPLYEKEELAHILEVSQRIKAQASVLVVIGIGGSYLGAKALYEAMPKHPDGVELVFAGYHLSARSTAEALRYIQDKDFCINVISKSGTTTEPAIAFRLFRAALEEKYGPEEAASRIYATTDATHGALRKLSGILHYETFVVPNGVGGRYSVLSPVGLVPIAAAGGNIEALLEGAKAARTEHLSTVESPGVAYASARYAAYLSGLQVELFSLYEPRLMALGQWWQQLFGESDGKEGKGLFPSVSIFSTDLHSLGQYIQEGPNIILETHLFIPKEETVLTIPAVEENLDELNYLAGKSLHIANQAVHQAAMQAHQEGDVPIIDLKLHQLDAQHLGYLLYMYMFACGMSGYALAVNPFNQPGVEAYKTNMFRLLGKPGFSK